MAKYLAVSFLMGLFAAGLILFAGYMCGAPIIERSPDNFPAYLCAGGALLVLLWAGAMSGVEDGL